MKGREPVQRDFFCNEQFPSWIRDETVFSLASRYHRLSGHSQHQTSARILFGHPRRGYQHDFAAGLQHLLEQAHGDLGTIEAVGRERTLLRYYTPFTTQSLCEDALDRMAGRSVSSLKYVLGLLTGGFRANHPLKSCSQCDSESTQENGVTIWRLIHQLPTSLFCEKHDEPLWISRTKSDGTDRFNWQLPDDQRCRSTFETLEISNDILRTVSAISRGIHDLGPTYIFEPAQMASTIKTRLDEWGFLTSGGSIRQRIATKSYLEAVGPLGSIASLRGLPTDRVSAESLIRSVVLASPRLSHPARYIAVVSWLWPTFSAFHRDYLCVKASDSLETPAAKSRCGALHPTISTRQHLIALLGEGASITCAADTLKISVATAQRIAAQCGITISRRPKKLKGERFERLLTLAGKGSSKQDIANELSVAPQTVMRVINSVPGLKSEWEESRKNKATHIYRSRWLAALADSSFSAVKAARTEAPAAYAWLYRNDRTWLHSINQRRLPRKASRGDAVDWAARDHSLAQAVGESRHADGFSGCTTIGRLCEQVPELRARVRQLHRLPKTADQVDRALIGAPVRDD